MPKCFECGHEANELSRLTLEYVSPEGVTVRRVAWYVCDSCIGLALEYFPEFWEPERATGSIIHAVRELVSA